MKDYRKLYQECREEMESIGMDISNNIVRVSVNRRLSRALGRCKVRYLYSGNVYEIELNPCILADDVEDNVPKNTIMHELLHTCKGCMNHGYNWTSRAEIVNRKLGYHVSRLTKSEGLEAAGVVLKNSEYKYFLKCDNCGGTCGRYKRWSSTLQNVGSYRCGRCKGNLHIVGLDGNVVLARPIWAANNPK